MVRASHTTMPLSGWVVILRQNRPNPSPQRHVKESRPQSVARIRFCRSSVGVQGRSPCRDAPLQRRSLCRLEPSTARRSRPKSLSEGITSAAATACKRASLVRTSQYNHKYLVGTGHHFTGCAFHIRSLVRRCTAPTANHDCT